MCAENAESPTADTPMDVTQSKRSSSQLSRCGKCRREFVGEVTLCPVCNVPLTPVVECPWCGESCGFMVCNHADCGYSFRFKEMDADYARQQLARSVTGAARLHFPWSQDFQAYQGTTSILPRWSLNLLPFGKRFPKIACGYGIILIGFLVVVFSLAGLGFVGGLSLLVVQFALAGAIRSVRLWALSCVSEEFALLAQRQNYHADPASTTEQEVPTA